MLRLQLGSVTGLEETEESVLFDGAAVEGSAAEKGEGLVAHMLTSYRVGGEVKRQLLAVARHVAVEVFQGGLVVDGRSRTSGQQRTVQSILLGKKLLHQRVRLGEVLDLGVSDHNGHYTREDTETSESAFHVVMGV